MKATFTPGPWTLAGTHKDQPEYIHAANQFAVALVPAGPTREANARLIAKAPEMRAALADLYEHCAMVHKYWGEGNNREAADAAITRGRALLAEIDTGA